MCLVDIISAPNNCRLKRNEFQKDKKPIYMGKSAKYLEDLAKF